MKRKENNYIGYAQYLIKIAKNFYVEEDFRTENCAKRDLR